MDGALEALALADGVEAGALADAEPLGGAAEADAEGAGAPPALGAEAEADAEAEPEGAGAPPFGCANSGRARMPGTDSASESASSDVNPDRLLISSLPLPEPRRRRRGPR